MKMHAEVLRDIEETTPPPPHSHHIEAFDKAMDKSLALTAEVLRGVQSAMQNQRGLYLTLYILTRQDPVFLSNRQKIIIGRADAKHDIHPTLDLTYDFARDLGVSRRHAQIEYHDGLYVIQDLGSRNGTWVNEQRLVPFDPQIIETGDSLRLGHLIIQVG